MEEDMRILEDELGITEEICLICDLVIDKTNRYCVGRYLFHRDCMWCWTCKGDVNKYVYFIYHDGRIYCKGKCIMNLPTTLTCAACKKGIDPEEFVRKIEDNIYHFNCLKCCICHVPLSTGTKVECIGDMEFRCFKIHEEGQQKEGHRTYINKIQKDLLRCHFLRERYPTSAEINKMALEVGLPASTVRIWFQNTRARGIN